MIQLAPEPTGTEFGRIGLHLPPAMHLDDDLLFAFCQANRDLRIERDAHGDLEIMPPTGAETGARNADLTAEVVIWANRDGRGAAFDSSTGFLLPNGAMRSPDVAWVLRERLATLHPEQKRKFLPLVPDLVIELASPTDDDRTLHAKLREWRDNGARLGWLILPDRRQVWRYAPGEEPTCLQDPQHLGDEALLPGLSLPLARIWEPNL
jgi:Uma2 family endonuclease